jgi:hypothetical protein
LHSAALPARRINPDATDVALSPLDVTFQCLARSENAAAADLLLLSLDLPASDTRERALAALLSRRDHPYQLQILARWESAGERSRRAIVAHPGRISSALRDAIARDRPELFVSACEVILATDDFDLAPALIAACERGGEFAPMAGETLLTLVARLHDRWLETLAPAADADLRREAALKRTHLLFALERSLDRYETHRAAAPVEALLALADSRNETLRRLLQNPRRGAHRAVVAALVASDSSGVIRLLLEFLGDPQAPSAIARAVGQRTDPVFLRLLLAACGVDPSPTMRNLVRRVDSFRWLEGGAWPRWFSDDEHRAAVVMIVASGMPRLVALDALRKAIASESCAARRAAAGALAEFHGAEANRLVLEGASDDDPQVQASCVAQLRERGIPTALAMLLDRLESPHQEVREAAGSALGEFTLARYLAAFETLSDAARAETGALVGKVDRSATCGLLAELAAPSRNRRLRALAAAPYVVRENQAAAEQIAAELAPLLAEEDATVRYAAANLLDDLRISAVAMHASAGGVLLGWQVLGWQALAWQTSTEFDLSSQPDPANFAGLLGVVLLLAIFALTLVIIKRWLAWRERPKGGSFPSLFGELCRAHRLSFSERRLLRRLAKAAEVLPLARLFVEPEHFSAETPLARNEIASLIALRNKLFG